MRKMIDPKSLNFNFDDKYLRLNMDTALGVQTLKNTGKYNSPYYIEFQVGSSGDRPHIKLYNDLQKRGNYYLTIASGYSDSQHGLPNFSYAVGSNTHARAYLPIGKGASSYNYTDIFLLANTNVKTLFGNQSIYSADGTGNIDLYKHNLKGVSGDNQVYIHITSSTNTPISSVTDLNTYLSNNNYYPATGVYKDGTTFYPIVFMTKSNNVWSVTYNKGTELGTALLSAVAGTITDTVTTV